MAGFTDDELAMFAADMTGGELAELLLIDQVMSSEGADAELHPLSDRLTREAHIATQAAVYAFGKDVQFAPNVIVAPFGRQI